GFVVTGTILLISDRMKKTAKTTKDITYFDALCIGAAQAVAIFPGVSRSGSTITAALARGINRVDAAKFVFLMSIPAILGALLVETVDIVRDYNITMADINFAILTAGFLASMISGYFAVKFMMAAIKKAKLRYFAFYVLILAIAISVYIIAF
ncbi:MAG: undecaprenyl-diphosphate phosphatase, partial [Defluviitaleaceae bacterium]|nr:undecaprenyl-diphosphate phosphatase [Defluviitaleaceae bacterium]